MEAIINWGIPFACTSVVGGIIFLIKWFNKTGKKFNVMIETLDKLNVKVDKLQIGHEELRELTTENDLATMWNLLDSKLNIIENQGYITSKQKVCLESLFNRYEFNGGNHGMEQRIKVVFALPLKNKIEEV